jgi:hypothetical protein
MKNVKHPKRRSKFHPQENMIPPIEEEPSAKKYSHSELYDVIDGCLSDCVKDGLTWKRNEIYNW